MQSLKLLLVLFSVVVVVHAIPEDENKRKIFKECAEANGFKPDPEKMKQMRQDRKKGEKQSPPEGVSNEFLCTQKCVYERVGLISDGKFNLEKVKQDKRMMHRIEADKVEAYLKCLEAVQIKECSDLKKKSECRKVST